MEKTVTRVDNNVDIMAPREKVFAYVSDVEAQPEWVKWAKRIEVTSPHKGAVGATDRTLMQVGPRKQELDGIVTEFRPPQVVSRRVIGGLKMEERISLVAVKDGTKVAWTVEYEPPMGPFGKVVDFLFMNRLMDQLMKDSLEILKGRLEQQ